MADISDVSNTLVTLIQSVVYPNGASKPSAFGSDARIFVGWPLPDQLDKDLAKGICEISVYPRPENRNTTRYQDKWQTLSVNTPTLALLTNGQTVTVAGTIPPATNPHHVVVFINGLPYVYAVLPSDTLAGIATILAAFIAANVPGTTSSGPVITLPPAARLNAARVGITGTAVREVRRQEQLFQIGVWAPTPAIRDRIAAAVDVMLAATFRFVLPDDTWCRLIWRSSLQSDRLQKANLYRRDLFYTAEYPTLQIEVETQITQIQENLSISVEGSDEVPLGTIYDVGGVLAGGATFGATQLLTETGDFLTTESGDLLDI